MTDVERLVAMEEIRALIATYAISFDDHDWDRFGALWTADAAFVVSGATMRTGAV
jgi:3-phenylpropionate/cinnamic acid dioxygenase small subunit